MVRECRRQDPLGAGIEEIHGGAVVAAAHDHVAVRCGEA